MIWMWYLCPLPTNHMNWIDCLLNIRSSLDSHPIWLQCLCNIRILNSWFNWMTNHPQHWVWVTLGANARNDLSCPLTMYLDWYSIYNQIWLIRVGMCCICSHSIEYIIGCHSQYNIDYKVVTMLLTFGMWSLRNTSMNIPLVINQPLPYSL